MFFVECKEVTAKESIPHEHHADRKFPSRFLHALLRRDCPWRISCRGYRGGAQGLVGCGQDARVGHVRSRPRLLGWPRESDARARERSHEPARLILRGGGPRSIFPPWMRPTSSF